MPYVTHRRLGAPAERERERESKRAGFTLVELLIYVGVFSIAAGLFTGVLSTLTRVQVRESATTEVSQQAQFVVQTVQRLVTNASIIELAANTATSTLKLRMADASRDPTCIQLSGGVVYLMEGNDGLAKQTCFATSSPQAKPLTDSKVVVNTLNFTKLANPPAKDTVKIDLTVAYNSTNPQESVISRTLQTAITKISAATFDSDIVPAQDNQFTVGLGAQRWLDGFFSRNLTVGGNVGIGTTVPGTALDVVGTIRGSNGLTISAGAVSLPAGSVANAALANSAVTVTAGTGLSGGGAVSLGSSVTLSTIPHGKQLFTTSGTFTVPTGVTQVWITLAGGGGGGGNSVDGCIGSGGGGGDAKIAQSVTGLTPGANITVTVGGGGAGGAAGACSPSTGGAGGASSFGAFVSAAGGGAGASSFYGSVIAGGAAGGSGGQAGQNATWYGTISGAGGGCIFGTGGAAGADAATGVMAGGGFCGGGAGGAAHGADLGGGAGAPGFVLVEW